MDYLKTQELIRKILDQHIKEMGFDSAKLGSDYRARALVHIDGNGRMEVTQIPDEEWYANPANQVQIIATPTPQEE